MISEHSLAVLRQYVAEAFKPGMRLFPTFTLHGQEHLEEVDRLAHLLKNEIPTLTEERFSLLRLALILHDFAMVDSLTIGRPEFLRSQLGLDLTIADLVRKTHQDEILTALSRPERMDFLRRTLSSEGGYIIDDACTIARHHRFHPLSAAPTHLRDLCALVRIIDEMDIGPKRAPISAYEALRGDMDSIARYHWLRHLRTRPIARDSIQVEIPPSGLRTLRLFIAVTATEESWQPIQDEIVQRLNICLNDEGINEILRTSLQVEIHASASGLSGSSISMLSFERDDLTEILSGNPGYGRSLGSRETPSSGNVKQSVESDPQDLPKTVITRSQSTLACESQGEAAPAAKGSGSVVVALTTPITFEDSTSSIFYDDRIVPKEFKLSAIPPDQLAESLCRGGKLTVIDNVYIGRSETNDDVERCAQTRVYFGPADCGKTRAALEWALWVTSDAPSQWVVLRAGLGLLPHAAESIVLDTSLYEAWNSYLPSKAILFLDDLPKYLPPNDSPLSAISAIRTLLKWFYEHSHFREKRVVGSLRLEDLYSRPGWLEVLQGPGSQLELIRISPLSPEDYSFLWRGMTRGRVCQSARDGLRPFTLDLEEAFLTAVSEREADPEAVAVFIQQAVFRHRQVLTVADSDRFPSTAVEVWLRETWPAIRDGGEVAARVFFTLSRLLAPNRDLFGSLQIEWAIHTAFGPPLCALHGGDPQSYLAVVRRLVEDGHALGEIGAVVRPRFDYLLDASTLGDAEFESPPAHWFAEYAAELSEVARIFIAETLSERCNDPTLPAAIDPAWVFGWGLGQVRQAKLASADRASAFEAVFSHCLKTVVSDETRGRMTSLLLSFWLEKIAGDESEAKSKDALLAIQLQVLSQVIASEPSNLTARKHLANVLSRRAIRESSKDSKEALHKQALDEYRLVLELDDQDANAWGCFGFHLGALIDPGAENDAMDPRRDEELLAYRKSVSLSPQTSWPWVNIGVRLTQRARFEKDELRRMELRSEALDAYERALQLDPRNPHAWVTLGVHYRGLVDDEPNEDERIRNLDRARDCFQRAVLQNPNFAQAWNDLGLLIGLEAKRATDFEKRTQLLQEEIDAYHRAATIDPTLPQPWLNLARGLEERAGEATERERAEGLRREAVAAYERAVSLEPSDPKTWLELAKVLGAIAEGVATPSERDLLRERELESCREATRANPSYWQGWDSLGVCLGLRADTESNPSMRREYRYDELAAHRRASMLDPRAADSLYNLGVCLASLAREEPDPAKEAELRDEAIESYRAALEVNPEHASSWWNLSSDLLARGHSLENPLDWQDALGAARHAAALGKSRYNIACALALIGEPEEALDELSGCLDRKDISIEYVNSDVDWTNLREHARFSKMLTGAT
jgi:tetratricopeptide (TPR) repeat protein